MALTIVISSLQAMKLKAGDKVICPKSPKKKKR